MNYCRIIAFFLFALYALTAQNANTYLGPDDKSPGALIRIQVLINDDPNPAGVQIQNVTFDGTTIPLKPRDIYGYRGGGSFQKAPGKYKLKWTVKRDANAWPRTVTQEQEVNVDRRDMWVQITITGESAAIT